MSKIPPDAFSSFPDDNDDDHRPRYGFKSRVLATAVLGLMFVFAFVVVLHLYLRCVLRRHISGRRRRTSIALLRVGTITTTTTATSPGMDPTAFAALPTYPHQRTGSNDVECAVCLSVIEEGEMVRLLPNCKHVFHVACIDMWLSSHSTCPVCRAEAEPVVQHQELSNEVGDSGGVREEAAAAVKEGGSTSTLSSSFRRMLSIGGRSGRRDEGDAVQDLERQ